MNVDGKLLGLLQMCPGSVDLHSSCKALVSTESRGMLEVGGTAKEMMTFGETSLTQQAHLAEVYLNEEQNRHLEDGPLPTHTVILCNTLMLHTEKVKKDQEVDPNVHHKLYHRLAPPVQIPINVKEELNLSDTGTDVKKERKQMKDLPENAKRKNRKQHNPAKILPVSSDGSSGLQTVKSHICEHCNATFRTNYHLQRHMFIHTGEKPFQCSQCDMRFIQKYLLQRHEKIHSGEKPFRCDECGMKFIQKYHMERHKRTHSGEKPYQCDCCLQFFSRTDRVLKHKRICHKDRDGRADRVLSKDRMSGNSEDHSLSFTPIESSLPKKKRKKSSQKSRGGPEAFFGNGETEDKVVQTLCKNNLPLYAISPTLMINECMVAEYSVEQPPAVCPLSWGSPSVEVIPPKVIVKKVSCKKVQKQHSEQLQVLSSDDGKAARFAFELEDKQGLLDANTSTDVDPARNLHKASHKPTGSSTNYDDAVQFLKKKRYLQGAMTSNGRGCDLSVRTITPQPSVSQLAISTVPDESAPAMNLDVQTLNVGVKSNHDKNPLPDEVLQTLLDHYSNKGSGQRQVSFGIAKTEVSSNVSVNSLDLPNVRQPGTLGTNSEALPSEKSNMLQEYSKFLQQALERTSQNDLNNHSLTVASESLNISSQPLFSGVDKYTVANRFLSEMNSPLRSSSEKFHGGLLAVDSQNSLSLSRDETSPSSVSSSEDFHKKVTSNETDAQVMHQTLETDTLDHNLHLQFQSLPETSSQFSIINRQVNLRGLGSGTIFPEFPLIAITKTRTEQTSSSDDISGLMFG